MRKKRQQQQKKEKLSQGKSRSEFFLSSLSAMQQLESPEQWTPGTTGVGVGGETERDTKTHTEIEIKIRKKMLMNG